MTSSSGPRFWLRVWTLSGECREKFAEGVAEAVAELLGGQGNGLMDVGPVLEHRQGGAQRGERQRQHALDLRGVDGDGGRAVVLAEQLLGDHGRRTNGRSGSA
jgi:hypothetical protein